MIHNPSFQTLMHSLTRRDVLKVVVGTGLTFLLPSLEGKAVEKRGAERPKSLITLWMGGGPSQLETWDPHPQSSVASGVRAIPTRLPGLEIAELFPRTAEQIHHLSVIRSMVSKEGDHERGTYYVQTGYRPDPTVVHPAMTAVISKWLNNDELEIPQHVALASGDGFVVPRGGYLGAEHDAFRIYDPGNNIHNMRPRVDDERQSRRLEGLEVLSRQFRQGRPGQVRETMHEQMIQRALTMMSSDQLKAFEIDSETEETKKKYGDSRFGRGCLVARRLVEQGVRAIQVTLQGFDTHANNLEGHRSQAEILDPAFSALIEDLVERDLLDSTIVLCIGEFGRTPWLNPLDGRDHWPVGFSCVVGGGGLRSGLVIGETSPDRAFEEKEKRVTESSPPKDPVSVPDLYATILTQMGVDPTEEIFTPIGRPIRLSEGSPLTRLVPNLA
ncbi:MAG: DUF1501 domain-containing protein [Planctomycetaceae bacterium]|nr:DUF1501 domain-containing protein [Planctomycetaceae bacterium]